MKHGVCVFENQSLEDWVKPHWRKYTINLDSLAQDIEQGYLGRRGSSSKTVAQQTIEERLGLPRGIPENPPDQQPSYEEQFFEGHAAQGGRVIDVASHLGRKGPHTGKLIHFGQPANARYVWVVDAEGNFIVANRQTMVHEMPHMDRTKIDYPHRLHKLPHPTPAKGKEIYGSGEVLVDGGKVRSFNTASGHYVDLEDVVAFNRQGQEVFRYFVKKVGWQQVEGGAIYQAPK